VVNYFLCSRIKISLSHGASTKFLQQLRYIFAFHLRIDQPSEKHIRGNAAVPVSARYQPIASRQRVENNYHATSGKNPMPVSGHSASEFFSSHAKTAIDRQTYATAHVSHPITRYTVLQMIKRDSTGFMPKKLPRQFRVAHATHTPPGYHPQRKTPAPRTANHDGFDLAGLFPFRSFAYIASTCSVSERLTFWDG